MFKVSIVLLNKTRITIESDEPEVLREIVSMALRDLPRDFAIQAASAAAGAASQRPSRGETRAGSFPGESVSSSRVRGFVATQEPSEPSNGGRNGQETSEMPLNLSPKKDRGTCGLPPESQPDGRHAPGGSGH